jgi:hypothetical protein
MIPYESLNTERKHVQVLKIFMKHKKLNVSENK